VLDIGHKETLHGVFQMVGSLLAPVTGMTSEEISRKLEERERMMSTALSPFISVPHILIPGTEEIWLCLIRCREGLFFDATHPDIKSMVILIGSEERREDHLKILTGLVHIFRHEEFREVWMDGKDMESIRDQLILLDRKRESSELI
jgi:mannitol/fructose-specific phosphotransferase system IIA component (Ntr-type)